jgi:hypothetical protein
MVWIFTVLYGVLRTVRIFCKGLILNGTVPVAVVSNTYGLCSPLPTRLLRTSSYNYLGEDLQTL